MGTGTIHNFQQRIAPASQGSLDFGKRKRIPKQNMKAVMDMVK